MTVTGPLLSSPLVSTQWLADNLGSPQLVVLDATVLFSTGPHKGFVSGDEQYLLNGHIPGAHFADLLGTFSDPHGAHPFTRPSVSGFEHAAASVGVSNDSTVVVYDSVTGQWASRIWWLFRAFGHDQVAVLDGGLTKWRQDGRPVDLGHVEPAPARFHAVERPELWVDKGDVEAIVAGSVEAGLVCGIPAKEYTGEVSHRERAGRIPGSINVPVGHLVDRDDHTLLDAEALRSKFEPVLDSKRIVTYCGAGIAATADALALTLLGAQNVAVYDGSLNEWVTDPNAPVVVGA